MNDFNEDLRYSQECEDNAIWLEIYHKAFPTLATITSHRKDGFHQRAGVDRSITLQNSKQILIDEKVRRKHYGDIALEFMANDQKKSEGWVCKPLLADYIAYAIIPTGKAYILPVIQLQAAWANHGREWKERFGTIRAKNATYSTVSCPVPVPELFAAIGKMLRVNFQPPTQ